MLFEVVPVAASDGEAPVAESPAVRIAVAAGAEEDRGGVLAGQRLGVGEGLERLVDGRVDGLAGADQGGVEGAADGRADQVVGHGDGRALLDELAGVVLRNVDAFAGSAAEERLFQFDEHDDFSRGSTDGVHEHDGIRPSPGRLA